MVRNISLQTSHKTHQTGTKVLCNNNIYTNIVSPKVPIFSKMPTLIVKIVITLVGEKILKQYVTLLIISISPMTPKHSPYGPYLPSNHFKGGGLKYQTQAPWLHKKYP